MEPNKILRSDFLDILFEGKNQEYGAYNLRRTYNIRIRNAVITTVIILLLVIGGFLISMMKHSENVHVKPKIADVNLTRVNIPKNQPPPPLPPPPPKQVEVKPSVKFTPPEIVKNKNVKPDEQPPDINQIKNNAIFTRNIKGKPSGIDPNLVQNSGNGVTAAPTAESNKVFKFVEQMPRFPGSINDEDSQEKILAFLHKNIVYPAMAKDNDIQGTVVVSFVVWNDGSIRDVKVVSGPQGGGLDQEAVRVVKMMPDWLPGKQNGRAVNVQYTLPIHFKLQ